jgi:hypothetical protein
MQVAALRQRLASIVAPVRTDAGTGAIATGIAGLDAALSDGGVPFGRLTEILGERGSGKATLARALVARAIAAGRWVAYIDATRTLAPRDWAPMATNGRLWVIRPRNPDRGAWSADVLLRSGAFGLVVLDGAPPLSREVGIRLTRVARDRDTAFVVVAGDPPGGAGSSGRGATIGSAVRLVVRREGRDQRDGGGGGGGGTGGAPARRRPPPGATQEEGLRSAAGFTITVEKGGTHQSVEVRCAIDVARRLCTHPEVPDRRGVARRNRRGERAGADVPGAKRPAGAGADRPGGRGKGEDRGGGRGRERAPGDGLRDAPTGATLARKRRCAEPDVTRDAFLFGGALG